MCVPRVHGSREAKDQGLAGLVGGSMMSRLRYDRLLREARARETFDSVAFWLAVRFVAKCSFVLAVAWLLWIELR